MQNLSSCATMNIKADSIAPKKCATGGDKTPCLFRISGGAKQKRMDSWQLNSKNCWQWINITWIICTCRLNNTFHVRGGYSKIHWGYEDLWYSRNWLILRQNSRMPCAGPFRAEAPKNAFIVLLKRILWKNCCSRCVNSPLGFGRKLRSSHTEKVFFGVGWLCWGAGATDSSDNRRKRQRRFYRTECHRTLWSADTLFNTMKGYLRWREYQFISSIEVFLFTVSLTLLPTSVYCRSLFTPVSSPFSISSI